VSGVVRLAGNLANHPRHARQRPQIGGEAPRRGTRAQRTVELPQVGGRKACLPPRPPCLAQRGCASLEPRLVPPMDAYPADVQPASYLRLAKPTGRKQPRRLFAAFFEAVEVPTCAKALGHAASLFPHTSWSGPIRYSIMRDSITSGSRGTQRLSPQVGFEPTTLRLFMRSGLGRHDSSRNARGGSVIKRSGMGPRGCPVNSGSNDPSSRLAALSEWRGGRDSKPATSDVTGRRSNQLNYHPAKVAGGDEWRRASAVGSARPTTTT
jgi:hypothetical protein